MERPGRKINFVGLFGFWIFFVVGGGLIVKRMKPFLFRFNTAKSTVFYFSFPRNYFLKLSEINVRSNCFSCGGLRNICVTKRTHKTLGRILTSLGIS